MNAEETAKALNQIAEMCHTANKRWWTDVKARCRVCSGTTHIPPGPTGEHCTYCFEGHPFKEREVGTLLMLMVSELSEAMEGDRKNMMDDKLPHRKMFEVELADAMIRILDVAGKMKLDIGGAFVEKTAYNATRMDHSKEGRLAEGGKQY